MPSRPDPPGGTEGVVWLRETSWLYTIKNSMSDYFTSLDPVARKRYVERLNLLGLDQSGDPYADSNSGKFANDMTKWPPVEFGHLFFQTREFCCC